MKTPTAIDRRPVFLGSWAAIDEDIADKDSPRRPQGEPREPKKGARRAQDAPKMGPRLPREGPRSLAKGSGSLEDGFKERYHFKLVRRMAPRRATETPRRRRWAQDVSKMAPKRTQDDPKMAQDRAKMASWSSR